MRVAHFAARAALAFALVFSCAAARDAAPLGAWIDRYEALRCEPYDIVVASRAPLRFATLGPCVGGPKPKTPYAHSPRHLVMVDTSDNSVRLVADDMLAGTLLHADNGLAWRWLAQARDTQNFQVELRELARGEVAPRVIASADFAPHPPRESLAQAGDACWLVFTVSRDDRGQRHFSEFRLATHAGGELQSQVVAGLRGVFFWHPAERAFAVQTDDALAPIALLDCAGNRRPPSVEDQRRLDTYPRAADVEISSRGDWAFSVVSPINDFDGYAMEDQIVVYREDGRREFGPFGKPAKGCPDIACIWDMDSLNNPRWSPSGEFLAVRGYPRSYILRPASLKVLRKWRHGGQAVFLTDSLVMDLAKNRGVTFYRW